MQLAKIILNSNRARMGNALSYNSIWVACDKPSYTAGDVVRGVACLNLVQNAEVTGVQLKVWRKPPQGVAHLLIPGCSEFCRGAPPTVKACRLLAGAPWRAWCQHGVW